MLRLTARLLVFGIVAALVAEFFFHTAIPAAEFPLSAQEPEFGLMIFDTAGPRDGTFTVSRFGSPRVPWHVNNCGWLSESDYRLRAAGDKPRIAVIGDSYVQGYHVNSGERISAVIEARLDHCADVYSFGVRGASLSQHVQVARYVERRFAPDVYIIVVQAGDLRDAVANYLRLPQHLQLRQAGDRWSEIPIEMRYRVSPVKRMLRHSATLRYLLFNREWSFGLGIPSAKAAVSDSALNRGAADVIVQTLHRELAGKPILFVVDGDRSRLNQTGLVASLPETGLLKNACAGGAGTVLDLAPIFEAAYRTDGQAINYRDDYHWNAHGHRIAGEAAAEFLRTSLFPHDNSLSPHSGKPTTHQFD